MKQKTSSKPSSTTTTTSKIKEQFEPSPNTREQSHHQTRQVHVQAFETILKYKSQQNLLLIDVSGRHLTTSTINQLVQSSITEPIDALLPSNTSLLIINQPNQHSSASPPASKSPSQSSITSIIVQASKSKWDISALEAFMDYLSTFKNLREFEFHLNDSGLTSDHMKLLSAGMQKFANKLTSFTLKFKDNINMNSCCNQLALLLSKMNSLESLNLSSRRCVIGSKNSNLILKAIRYCSSLKRIRIDFSKDITLTSIDVPYIGQILSSNPNLESLYLNIPDAQLDDEQGCRLSQFFFTYAATSLTHLYMNLKSNQFSFDTLEQLAKSLAECKRLESIRIDLDDSLQSNVLVILYVLSRNQGELSVEYLTPIHHSMYNPELIQEDAGLILDFKQNSRIGDAGVLIFAPIFEYLNNLNRLTLNLSAVKVGNRGMVDLSESLAELSTNTLTHLDLDFSFNYIGEPGISSLSRFIRKCENLIELRFSSEKAGLVYHEVESLILAIPHLTQLRGLEINFNYNPTLSMATFVQIAESAAKHLSYLKKIGIFFNHVNLVNVNFDPILLKRIINKRLMHMKRLIDINY